MRPEHTCTSSTWHVQLFTPAHDWLLWAPGRWAAKFVNWQLVYQAPAAAAADGTFETGRQLARCLTGELIAHQLTPFFTLEPASNLRPLMNWRSGTWR